MTRAEWIELALIGVATAGSSLIPPELVSDMTFAEAVLYSSALLLLQGLVRDIAILLRAREFVGLQQEDRGLCLESAIGVTGVTVGTLLFGSTKASALAVSDVGLFIAVAATLSFGFLIKDLVIFWQPFSVRRVRNHLNVMVRGPRRQ